jgi:hypothetical protein
VRISNVALSRGVLLLGNQPCAPIGSPTTNAPSVVWNQPSCDPSGSVIGCGTPE